MKKWISLFLVFLLLSLTGCKPIIENPVVPFYTVQFDSNGGTEIESQRIEEGKKAVKPKNPTKEDSIFDGWYLLDKPYHFTEAVTEDITLTAQWKSSSTNNGTDDSFENYGMDVIDITLSDLSISESGLYTSMEEVGAYIYTYHKLPSNFHTKSEFNKLTYTKENKLSVGGDIFYNREGLLPYKQGRTYTECDIDYTGNNRNAKRIVFSSDFLIFYTSNHYSSFSILRFL
ncbi:MAG: InlB B-repeat-containing protein [Anaeroplasmataceae bacterium]|nr:InlB B-repeat-containing protein [Anaeroplasmataceae bacterium]MDE6414714.1 InlB B-repeat-containing protein [Anaeroplasmataceae bacterium]